MASIRTFSLPLRSALSALALLASLEASAQGATPPIEAPKNLPPPVPSTQNNPFKPPPAPPPVVVQTNEEKDVGGDSIKLGAIEKVIDQLTYVGMVNGKTIYAYKKGNCYVTVENNQPVHGDCYRLAWLGVRNTASNP